MIARNPDSAVDRGGVNDLKLCELRHRKACLSLVDMPRPLDKVGARGGTMIH